MLDPYIYKQVDNNTTIIRTPTHQPQQRRAEVPPERVARGERELQCAEEAWWVRACEGNAGYSTGCTWAYECKKLRQKST